MKGQKLQKKRKKIIKFPFCLFLILCLTGISTYLWFQTPIQVQAAKKEQKTAAGKQQAEELVLAQKDVTGGRLRIPAGTYQRILIRGDIQNASIYMKDVIIKDTLTFYKNSGNNITLILSGQTKIQKLAAKRNITITSLDNKLHIQTLSVRAAVMVKLLTDVVNFSIPEQVTGAQGLLYGNIGYLRDLGEKNVYTTYAEVNKAKLEGKQNVLIVRGSLEKLYLYGEGNRVSVRTNIEEIIVNGIHNTLSVDEQEARIGTVRITGGSYKIVRPERIGKIQDQSKQPSPDDCQTLFIGDSHTERLYIGGYLEEGMDALFGRGTAAPHWFLAGRYHLNYRERLADYHPKRVIYMYGVNGIWMKTNVKYSKELLKELMEAYPKAEIYVQRIFPLGDNYSGTGVFQYELYNRSGSPNIKEFNQEMKSFCQEYKQLHWIDTTKGLIDKNGNLERSMTEDGLHLNDAGYQLWWKNIWEKIKK